MLHLVVTDEASAWRVAWLEVESVTLGRGPDCDVALPDPRLERQHLTLRLTGGGREVELEAHATVHLDATDEAVHRGERRGLAPADRVAFGGFVLQAAAPAGLVGVTDEAAGGAAGPGELARLQRMAVQGGEPALARQLYREGLRRGDPALCVLGLAGGAPSASAWTRLLLMAAGDGGSWDAPVSDDVVAALDRAWPDALREAPAAWRCVEALAGADEGLWRLVRAVRLGAGLDPVDERALLRSPVFARQARHVVAEGAAAVASLLRLDWGALSGVALGGVTLDAPVLGALIGRTPPTLATLGLPATWLDDPALEALARLRRPAGLRVLDLGHNPFGPRGLRALRRGGWLEGLEALTLPVDALRGEATPTLLAELLGATRLTLTPALRGARPSRAIGELVVRGSSTLERHVTGAQVEVELSPSASAWSDRHRLRFRLDAPSRSLSFLGSDAELDALGLSAGERVRLRDGALAHGEWLDVGRSQLTMLLAEDFEALWREPSEAEAAPGLPPSRGVHVAPGVATEDPTQARLQLGIAHRGEAPVWIATARERVVLGLDVRACDVALVGVEIAPQHLALVLDGDRVVVERVPDAEGALAPVGIDGRVPTLEREPLGASETLFVGPFMVRARGPHRP